MPLAVITGLLFCMGCITPTEDDDEYDRGRYEFLET